MGLIDNLSTINKVILKMYPELRYNHNFGITVDVEYRGIEDNMGYIYRSTIDSSFYNITLKSPIEYLFKIQQILKFCGVKYEYLFGHNNDNFVNFYLYEVL